MPKIVSTLATSLMMLGILFSPLALAKSNSVDGYHNAITKFKQSSDTQSFFNSAYAYAIFPTVGKGGIGIGIAYGNGRVYKNGVYMGNTSLTQLSAGLQLGGQVYSEIIFFKDAQAYQRFTRGSFEFGAQASAVAIVVGANAQAGTTGNSVGAGHSGINKAAKANYIDGTTVFIAVRGGFMLEAALAGQSFSYDGK